MMKVLGVFPIEVVRPGLVNGELPAREAHYVRVVVDAERLARELGRSAVLNRGGVSREAGGAVLVEHVKR